MDGRLCAAHLTHKCTFVAVGAASHRSKQRCVRTQWPSNRSDDLHVWQFVVSKLSNRLESELQNQHQQWRVQQQAGRLRLSFSSSTEWCKSA